MIWRNTNGKELLSGRCLIRLRQSLQIGGDCVHVLYFSTVYYTVTELVFLDQHFFPPASSSPPIVSLTVLGGI